MEIIRRFLDHDFELETRDEGGSPSIVGYAAVFYNERNRKNTELQLFPGLVERIMPSAFDKALAGSDDVVALYNHDPNRILGRRSAGTLRLQKDSKGLKYSIDPDPDTTIGKDVMAHIKRRDLKGSSFAMVATKITYAREKDYEVRMIESVDLYDVGPVTFPAYAGTSTDVRSLQREFEDRNLKALQCQLNAHLRLLSLDI